MNPVNNLDQQAIAALNAGQPQQAIALLEPVCGKGTGDAVTPPRHWFLLGVAFGMAGNAKAAERAFREVLALDSNHVEALANLGRALAEQDRPDEAVETLQQALEVNPGYRPARIGVINALTQLKRYEEAERHCDKLMEAGQNDVEALALSGSIHKERGDLGRALARFDQVLAVSPGHLAAQMNKGLVLRMRGQERDALECFSRASQLAPQNPSVWYIKGMTHIAVNEMEQAAESLEEAFRLNPGYVDAGGQLASVYRHLRRIPESVEVSRRVLEADPTNVRARFYVKAFGDNDSGPVQRIPREVAESTYRDKDVGRNFEASLKGGLEYRAPDVLEEAVREHCAGERGGLDIIELGCGTGLCGSRLADIARSLVGTDLSPSMLEVAREKQAYTDLYVADLIDVLTNNPAGFDLVIAMDVLCYFGDLTEIFCKCHDTLRAGGVFAFSVEKPDDDELWLLHPYGHFVHSLRHIRESAESAGFEEVFVREMMLRREASEPRIGYVCLYRRG